MDTRADGETRTPDPFITSEVLYQLSYVGGGPCIVPGSERWRSLRSASRGAAC